VPAAEEDALRGVGDCGKHTPGESKARRASRDNRPTVLMMHQQSRGQNPQDTL
jgi:hypothetical protein